MIISSSYVIRKKAHEIILINKFNSSEIYKFEGISKNIFERVMEGKLFDEIVDEIAKNYNVERKIINKDVNKFIIDLKSLKIIEE